MTEEDDTFSKIGEAVTDSTSTKTHVSKTATTIKKAIKGTKKEKPIRDEHKVLDSILPYGDEKSIKRTIGAGIVIISLIGLLSIIAAGFVIFATELIDSLGFLFALLIFIFVVALIIGLIGFFFVTNPRHEKDEDDISKRLGER